MRVATVFTLCIVVVCVLVTAAALYAIAVDGRTGAILGGVGLLLVLWGTALDAIRVVWRLERGDLP